jgi:Protein of unknown function (DUF3313)
VSKSSLLGTGSAIAACIFVAACAGPQPAPYTGIASASQLKPNLKDDNGKIPYKYTTPVSWADYSKAIIDPVQIYRGPDNQFGGMTEVNKTTLTRYMQKTFGEALSKRFAIASSPSPQTIRVKLTLTGASGTGFIGMFAHVDMGGNVYNGIQAVRGGQGLGSGWVMYTVEIQDASNGQLLEAYEAKEFPNAFNIGGAFGSLAAAKIGVDKGADMLVAQTR